MKPESIRTLLEGYRPGEGLEEDPQMRAALDAAVRDPELVAFRARSEDFDAAFAARLRQISAPDSLRESILRAAAQQSRTRSPSTKHGTPAGRLIAWIHPSIFAVAAILTLSLALFFTFANRSAQPVDQNDFSAAMASAGPMTIIDLAAEVMKSNRPEFRSSQPSHFVEFIDSRGGRVPRKLPGHLTWNDSIACDVVQMNGRNISIVCFKPSGVSNVMHMVVFKRSELDMPLPGPNPQFHVRQKMSFATWSDGEMVHVVLSECPEENLRAALEI